MEVAINIIDAITMIRGYRVLTNPATIMFQTFPVRSVVVLSLIVIKYGLITFVHCSMPPPDGTLHPPTTC